MIVILQIITPYLFYFCFLSFKQFKDFIFHLISTDPKFGISLKFNNMNNLEVESPRRQTDRKMLSSPLLNESLDVPHVEAKLKSPQITLGFKNISYSVKVVVPKEGPSLPCLKQTTDKIILDNVSGIVNAGEVAAIIGASGAGKTSLLNIIACRIAKTSGQLLANNVPYNYKMFGDFANYVMQSDVLMQTLTVRETLLFAADLRLPLSKKDREERVYQLAKNMKLLKCLDTLVGGPIVKGISGGEKKRTSIAFELISDPQVIVLDEPTSGLDSLTSFIIVDYLSKLAREKGRTVLMTIHQPNSDIFAKFDRLFVMVEGKMVYQGSPQLALDYFQTNFQLKCQQYVNPAEFIIEHVHHDNPANVERYSMYYDTYSKKVAPVVLQAIEKVDKIQVMKRLIDVSTVTSFGALVRRAGINLLRNPMLLKSRVTQSIIIGVYLGGLYWDDGRDSYTNISDAASIIGFLFCITISSLMSALGPVSLIFPSERQVFLKQESSRLYNTFSYFVSKNLLELPYLLITPLLMILVFYWMIGLQSTVSGFFLFYLSFILVHLCGNSLGMFMGSIINDQKAVAAVTPALIMPFVLFSGFFKNSSNLPEWLGWIQYLSPIKYGFEALTINQIGSGGPIIEFLSFSLGFWRCIGCLFGLTIGFGLLALLFLWLFRNKLQ